MSGGEKEHLKSEAGKFDMLLVNSFDESTKWDELLCLVANRGTIVVLALSKDLIIIPTMTLIHREFKQLKRTPANTAKMMITRRTIKPGDNGSFVSSDDPATPELFAEPVPSTLSFAPVGFFFVDPPPPGGVVDELDPSRGLRAPPTRLGNGPDEPVWVALGLMPGPTGPEVDTKLVLDDVGADGGGGG
ncbi:hypothetical protein BGX28_000408 [Mortierella sp. GBA30]|nr:hypothetical protein BGX28_000408 [Mortierella sp. GBA30]